MMRRARVRGAGLVAFGAVPAALTFAILFGMSPAPARADSWALPQKQRYYSPNKRFAFEVTPKKLESQLKYFSDKVEGRPNAGAAGGGEDNRCKGALLEQRGGGPYARRASFALVNEVAPVDALVADSGRYVVTFDNWHAVGYGDDVVVIYRADGTLVGKLGLADFLTEKDIETLPRSVSSIWWGGEHYLDEPAGHLVLRVVADGARGDERGKYHELRIALATGQPVEPKRDLLAELHRRMYPAFVVALAVGGADDAAPGGPTCLLPDGAAAAQSVTRVASAELLARAEQQTLPRYPPIAQAARAMGAVVVEVVIDGAGTVSCARPVSGHPLLRQAAVNAVRAWKFKPAAAGGRQFGRLAFEFGAGPPGENQE